MALAFLWVVFIWVFVIGIVVFIIKKITDWANTFISLKKEQNEILKEILNKMDSK